MATIQDIKSNASLVKNATGIGENTAERVGGVLTDMTDYLSNLNANTGIDEYEDFSDQKEYKAGTTVLKDGLLKTFKVDHAAGAWNPDEVEDGSIKKEVERNNTDIFHKNGLFFLKDGYYYHFTGKLENVAGTSDDGCCSALIHVTKGKEYQIVVDSNVKYWWVSFFNAAGKYLRYEAKPNNIVIDNDDYYVALNLQYASKKTINDVMGTNYIKFNEKNIFVDIASIKDNISKNDIHKYNSDLRYKQSVIPYINGRYYDFNGNFIETKGCCTGFRSVKKDDLITVNSDSNVVAYSWCAIFDKDYNFLRYTTEKNFSIGENESFICFNVQFKNNTISIQDIEKHHVGILINSNFNDINFLLEKYSNLLNFREVEIAEKGGYYNDEGTFVEDFYFNSIEIEAKQGMTIMFSLVKHYLPAALQVVKNSGSIKNYYNNNASSPTAINDFYICDDDDKTLHLSFVKNKAAVYVQKTIKDDLFTDCEIPIAEGKYYDSTGELTNDAWYGCAEINDLVIGEKISYNLTQAYIPAALQVVKYDNSVVQYEANTSEQKVVSGNYIVQQGDKKIQLSFKLSAEHSIKRFQLNKDMINVAPLSILYKKSWYSFGDSVTEAANTTYVESDKNGNQKGYTNIIGTRNNMNWTNGGHSGWTLTKISGKNNSYFQEDEGGTPMYKKVKLGLDYYTFWFGINDCYQVEEGNVGDINSTDTTTIYGAWNTLIDYFIRNSPNSKIGIIVPYRETGMRNSESKEGRMALSFIKACKDIADKYGIGLLDLTSNDVPMFVDRLSDNISDEIIEFRRSNWLYDGTHPNQNGYNYLSTIIESWLKTL